MTGIYLAFEGLEGCGKTTQVRLLEERLQQENTSYITVREPGGTEFGEAIRDILFGQEHKRIFHEQEMDARTEVLLFAAARAELIKQKVKPALEQGQVVISDRTLFSSLAYQGHGRCTPENYGAIETLNVWAVERCLPHRVYFLNIEPKAGIARKQEREKNRFEAEQLKFHDQVRRGFQELAKRYETFLTIEIENKPSQEIHEIIWKDYQSIRANSETTNRSAL